MHNAGPTGSAAGGETIRALDQIDLWSLPRSNDELGWIAELTRVMSSTLDEHAALARLAALTTPRLADVTLVDLIDDHGQLIRLGGSVAPGLAVDLDRVLADEHVQPDPDGNLSTRDTIIATPSVRLFTADEISGGESLSPSSRRLLAAVGAKSMIVVPLGTPSQRVAVAALIRQDADAYGEEDLLLAADVGRRAGLVLDNARLYRRQEQSLADMQLALLPIVREREHPHAIAAARYLPARERDRVGGDWYDLFTDPREEILQMVIGDVAGHDLGAATTMAALRNLLRGVAIAATASPAHVIATVDAALDPFGISTTATTLFLSASRGPHDWRLTWSNAGHPPPLLIGSDGGVRTLDGADPLLGARLRKARHDQTAQAPFGSTLIFYTDGLVERRDQWVSDGIRLLTDTIERHAVRDGGVLLPNDLLQVLIDRMPLGHEDDTALLAVALQ